MKTCSNCGITIPPGRKHCFFCKRATENAKKGKTSVAVGVIIVVLFLGIIFNATAFFVARVRENSEPDRDVGLQLDGTWATESLTFNDEHITYVFYRDSFTSVKERTLFDANPEALDSLTEYYRANYEAAVDTEYIGDGNYFIRITSGGTFTLDGDSILLIKGEGRLVPHMFDWDGVAIYIDGYRFLRQ